VIHQDRIVIQTPCHALSEPRPILYLRPMFFGSRKEWTA